MTMEPQPLSPGKCAAMCVFGVPGSGKTRLLGSGSNVLILRPPTDHTDSITDTGGVEEMVVHDHDELAEVLQFCQQGKARKYGWVGFDGVSLFEDHGLDDVFAAAIKRKPERAEHGPDKGEYGVNRGRIMKFLRTMVGLAKAGEFHFLVTAGVMEITDPVKDTELWVPQFGSPKGAVPISLKLCGMMNIVAYQYADEREGKPRREALVVDRAGFIGKDQFGAFPESSQLKGDHGFVDPTLPDIEAALKKTGRDSSTRPPARTRKAAGRKRVRRKAS